MNRLYLLITFTGSFATMCYAMILASLVTGLTGKEILAQCLVMGPYLLGLGFGSLMGDRVKDENSVKFIWNVEWLSVLILPLIPVIQLFFIFFFLHLVPLHISMESNSTMVFIFSLASVFGLFIGVMGGAQLPLIIRRTEGSYKSEIVLAINYLGPLLAGPFIVYCNSTSFPASGQVGIVALIQLLGLFFLLQEFPSRVRNMLLLAIPMLFIIFIARFYPRLEFLTVKASYLGTRLEGLAPNEIRTLFNSLENYGVLLREKTPYQTIDLLTVPAEEEFASSQNSTLFLNMRTQFNVFTSDLYHQSMVHGGMNLSQKPPKRVLVLGAGDGVLLKELKNFQSIEHIDLVEIDQGIIDFSRENLILSKLNDDVFSNPDPRLNIIVDDAITWLRRLHSGEVYDMVFIDFPFPFGNDLAKLYSLEFYTLVKKVTRPDSIVVIDLPVQRTPEGELTLETRVILKTMKEAGLVNQLPYGPLASFIAVNRDSQKLEFDYDKFPEDMRLSTRLNLVRITDEKELEKTQNQTPVNSMFWPRGL